MHVKASCNNCMLCKLVSLCLKAAKHMAKLYATLHAALNRHQSVRNMVHLIRGVPHAGDAPKTDRYNTRAQGMHVPASSAGLSREALCVEA